MKKFKVTALVLSIAMSMSLLASCNTENNNTDNTKEPTATQAQKTTVRVATLKGPTGIGMVKLMEDNESGKTANKYEFSIAGAPEEVVAKVTSGEVDVAAVPTNLAATLYKKTKGTDKGVQLAAINTLGVLYVLEKGNTINSVEDLRGKTLYYTGQGATPEYILKYILRSNGIDPEKDITLDSSKTEHAELATLAVANEVVLCMLPEPNVTTVLSKNKDFRIALNLTEEYQKAAEKNEASGYLAMGGIIVNKEFANNNKDAFNKFLDEYKASTTFANSNVEEAAQLTKKFEIIPSADIAKSAIPNCNIIFIEGTEMKDNISEFFKVLFEAEPKSIGGELPDDGFYYKR